MLDIYLKMNQMFTDPYCRQMLHYLQREGNFEDDWFYSKWQALKSNACTNWHGTIFFTNIVIPC